MFTKRTSSLMFASILFQVMLISLYFGRLNVFIGFALKPFMILTLISVVFFIANFRFSKLFAFEILFICFILISSLSAMQLRYPAANFRFIMVHIVMLVFYFTARGIIIHLRICDIERMLFRAGLIGTIFSLVYYLIGVILYNISPVTRGILGGMLVDRNTLRLTGLASNDPNMSVFYITLFFLYTLTHLNRKECIIGFILSSLYIVLSFSRGGYVSMIAGVLFLFVIEGNRKKQLKYVLIIGASIFILIVSMSYLNIDIIKIVVDRFLNLSNDGGSGRLILWTNAYNIFKENSIWGIGINSFLSYSEQYGLRRQYVHNSFLEVLAELGLVGFTSYMIFWMAIFSYSIKLIKTKVIYLCAVFISMFFQMMFISLLYNECFYVALLVLYRYCYEYIKGKRDGEVTL